MTTKPFIKKARRRSRDLEALRRRIRARLPAKDWLTPRRAGIALGVLTTLFAAAAIHHRRPLVDRLSLPEQDASLLKETTLADPARGGPRVAILPYGKPDRPRFVIASNLREASFEFKIESQAPRLLGKLSYEQRFEVRLNQGYGLTPAFNPPPAGHYTLTVNESKARLSTELPYTFYGGMAPEDLERAITKYKDDLKVQAAQELMDLEKLRSKMDQEFNALYAAFQVPGRLPARKRGRILPSESRWRETNRLAQQIFSTPEDHVFYSSLFQSAKGIWKEISGFKKTYENRRRMLLAPAHAQGVAERIGPQLFNLKEKILAARAVASQSDFPPRD